MSLKRRRIPRRRGDSGVANEGSVISRLRRSDRGGAGLSRRSVGDISAADPAGKPRPDRVRTWHELVRARRSRDQLRPRAERFVLEHRASSTQCRRRAVHNRQWNELDDYELHRRRWIRLSMERLAAVRRHVGLPHRPWRNAPSDSGLAKLKVLFSSDNWLI